METCFRDGWVSEGNVLVVEVIALISGLGCGRGLVGGGVFLGGGLGTIPAARTGKELKVVANDLELGSFFAGLGFPGVQLKAAFDEDGASFGNVLGNRFGGRAESINIYKGGIFLFLAFAGTVDPIDGQAQFADGEVAAGHPHFGIPSEVADQ